MNLTKPHHREWHGTHHYWEYRPHAFLWSGQLISGLNFQPLATEMREWLRQRGRLSIWTRSQLENGPYTNPYSASGCAVGLVLARSINDFHLHATTESDIDSIDAEIQRVRLHNEILLYTARFTEATIKQLLHCTAIPPKRYSRMAMGQLLESRCPDCRAENGSQPHDVSMVGTLAHPFHLCLEFEHCAMDHMSAVNRMRNSFAAHSDIQDLNFTTAERSRQQLLIDGTEALEGFAHMLSHLGDLEQAMQGDLEQKADEINRLKFGGMRPEDCNFKLVPGRHFSGTAAPT